MVIAADQFVLKLKAGKRMVPVSISKEGNRLFLSFPYNKTLLTEIKEFHGSKWHGFDENPRKCWSILDNPRNRFQLAYLSHPDPKDPANPYRNYEGPLVDYTPTRPLFAHQLQFVREILTRHYYVLGAEMGTGKTLAAIEAMEASGVKDWFWVGPRSALAGVKLEFERWRAKVTPAFFTYEGIRKEIFEWPDGKKPPQGVVFDEASRLKNPTAKRTQAAQHLANAIREEWGQEGFVIEMSGTPAPKSPVDWWSLAEVACPGFVREGTVEKFKRRLAIIEQRNSFEGGGSFPHLVAWKDDERRCDQCGKFLEDHLQDPQGNFSLDHFWKPSVNEVAYLSKRLAGLVTVAFKKDCLDLPDKVYKEIQLKPSRSTLNAASALQSRGRSVIQTLTWLRELSDGFQYVEEETGTQTCKLCHGRKAIDDPTNVGRTPDAAMIACPHCDATGTEPVLTRTAVQIPTPKEDALREILDEHDDVGRLVVYAGFTGSVDRVCQVCQDANWQVIRVDGRGWFCPSEPCEKDEVLLKMFQYEQVKHPRVVFVGQPGAAGMGVTLTASPTIVFWSNDFNAESRMQSEDRIHRAGMDTNRGATIIDLHHLPSDKYVLDNLKRKRRLQDMTMGQVAAGVASVTQDMERSF